MMGLGPISIQTHCWYLLCALLSVSMVGSVAWTLLVDPGALLDVARAVSSQRAEPSAWCRSERSPEETMTGVSVRHPLVPSPVANHVSLELAAAIGTCLATMWTGRALRVRSLIGRAS
jgi:hypothetical protein